MDITDPKLSQKGHFQHTGKFINGEPSVQYRLDNIASMFIKDDPSVEV